MINITDVQKLGIGLVAFGISFLFLGVLLLLDKGLLAIGNILFISGLACLIGFSKTFRFFFQLNKVKGSLCFFGGIVVVLLGWPLIGMILELYGFISLFSGFFPMVINVLRSVPLLGTLLNLPFINRLAGDSHRTMV